MSKLAAIKADFKNCLFVVWRHLGLPPPTPVQYAIADYLQYGGSRALIEAFRGVGKSWICSVYVLWVLLNDPDHKFLIVSASKARSDDFSSFTKRLITEMSLFHCLKSNPAKRQRDTLISFDVGPARPAHAPSVKSVGIYGQLTGSRANTIIGDDVEVAQNSATEDAREKLEKATKEFEAILSPGGRILFLGTPQCEESIYNKLPSRGYDVRIWPARYPSMSKLVSYKGFLAPEIMDVIERDPSCIDKPTDPKRFSVLDLIEREASYGKSGFALQFMLDTSLSDAERYPLRTADLIVTSCNNDKAPISIAYASSPELQWKDLANVGFTGDRWYRPMFIDPEWREYEGSVMFIDPSGRGSDECGYAVVKHLHGVLYLTAAGGFKGGYEDEVLLSLAKIAREQRVNQVLIEANFGDGMFTRLFSPVLAKYHQCAAEEIKVHGQKEKRIIDTLEPVMQRHKLVVDLDVVKNDLKEATEDQKYSLFYQLTRITKDRGALRHDDRLDALAGAVAYWVESMSRDLEQAVDSYKDELLQRELDAFVNGIIFSDGFELGGARPQKERWFNIGR